MNEKPIALLSAFQKDAALRDFAESLVGLGWQLLASAGTKKFLDGYSIPSKDVGDLVGEPILGHRVVTLDRRLYASILAKDTPEDRAELARLGVSPIKLVYVSFYPLEEELKKPNRTRESVIESTDIGGPTMLRAAAKGGLLAVSSPDQFTRVTDFLMSPPKDTPMGMKARVQFYARLAAEAEQRVADYAALSARFHRSVADGAFPDIAASQ